MESEKATSNSVNGDGDAPQNGTSNGTHHSNGTNGVTNGKHSPPKKAANGIEKTDTKEEIASELFGVCRNL